MGLKLLEILDETLSLPLIFERYSTEVQEVCRECKGSGRGRKEIYKAMKEFDENIKNYCSTSSLTISLLTYTTKIYNLCLKRRCGKIYPTLQKMERRIKEQVKL